MEEKLFNKGFLTITIINFIVYLVYYLMMVIIAVVAHDQLHASFGQAGLASGIYIIGTLIARLVMGKELELIGRKRVARWGAILYLITTIAYLAVPTIAVLDGVRLLNGFAYGMTSTALNAIVTEFIPEKRKGEGINYYGLSTSLAAAIGPFIGLLLLNATSFQFIVILSAILIGISMVALFAVKINNVTLSAAHLAELKSWKVSSFIEFKVLLIAGIGFLMGLSYSSVLAFLASYAETLHLVAISSFFFVVYAGIVTLTRPMSGRIFDRFGENYVMYPSYLFLAFGLVILAFAHNGFVLLLSGAFIGLGYGTFMSNGQAVTLKLVTSHRIGIALSTYFIGLDLGLGVGPYVLGALHNSLSFRELYLVSAVIPIVSAILYLLFYRPNKAKKVTQKVTKRELA
ncbi:MFS transporter [Leuconostoc falkenbergense]|jgi:MFS family permease|uniref:MFS transporter n=1 Tax=Leuconostoc falkenbergense TaxID=2766470 RepID=A0A9X3IQ05_9LACO|nr:MULTISPECIES: MFS transporter [Leuconostoc]MDN6419594.1 MFS transporter [Lactiplantibacillus plantarum]RDG18345.1 MFS transporter [Leuconostoc pseudomesenteroides]MCT4389697.1 MFS transporter [Leuconostoc falkenbergense]MCT4411721.1 MFS transporter [Leuconostoc falkenbergense]MCX7577975.1 MFS transporter [Leuconostoc falkenbergense]